MKLYTTFIYLIFSTALFAQLDKLSQIEVTDSTIILNDSLVLSFPMHVQELTELFGEARLSESPNSSNLLYFWDKMGIVAFTQKGKNEITSFEVSLARSSLGSNPRRKFRGKLIIDHFLITKKTKISDLSTFGYTTSLVDDRLPSWHTLSLSRLTVIVETEPKAKRTNGVGIAKRR